MRYSANQIIDLLSCEVFGPKTPNEAYYYFTFDSRKIAFPKRSIFIALKTEKNDGHRFVSSAYEKGVRAFLISEPNFKRKFEDAVYFVVTDVLKAVQDLGRIHRNEFDLPVVGITGSNGKTIVKEWLANILDARFKVVKSPKSYNSQLGVPLSVLQIDDHHELGIFEAGISKANEMENLAGIIQPNVGIFTNLGDAHSSGFKSQKEKLIEKLALFQSCEKLIYQSDTAFINDLIESTIKDVHLISWSFERSRKATYLVHIHGYELTINELKFQLVYNDVVSVQNITNCIICALEFGLDPALIQLELNTISRISNRLELNQANNNCMVINDSYNSDLESLVSALDFLYAQSQFKRNAVVLTDLFQSAIPVQELYQKIEEIIKTKGLQKLILIGKDINLHLVDEACASEVYRFKTTEEFLKNITKVNFNSEGILLKGARQFQLEEVHKVLSSKVHNAILEIDLNALRNNFYRFKNRLREGCEMMAVIKASAYGSGSVEMAKTLLNEGVSYFAVAYIDEGVKLREAGIMTPIMVMNPEESGFHLLVKNDIEPQIYSLEQLKKLLYYIKEEDHIKIHIKVNSGMNRLGFVQDELSELVEILAKNNNLLAKSVLTHLVSSENHLNDKITESQVKSYLEFADLLDEGLENKPIRHVLNSNGILRLPQYHFDMVRLGIGLYGIQGIDEFQANLESVHSLKARIVQIRKIRKGAFVGYGPAFYAEKEMTIGTINIGYADGLMRQAGNQKFSVKWKKYKLPIISNICMDMCMVDLSAASSIELGDEVVVFDDQKSLEELAIACETISYEILSRISSRVKRKFIQEF